LAKILHDLDAQEQNRSTDIPGGPKNVPSLKVSKLL